MSLISREALIAEYDRVHIGEQDVARKLVVAAPEVVSEIIRCIDCEHRRQTCHGDTWCSHPKGLDGIGLKPTDFCSKAERKIDR